MPASPCVREIVIGRRAPPRHIAGCSGLLAGLATTEHAALGRVLFDGSDPLETFGEVVEFGPGGRLQGCPHILQQVLCGDDWRGHGDICLIGALPIGESLPTVVVLILPDGPERVESVCIRGGDRFGGDGTQGGVHIFSRHHLQFVGHIFGFPAASGLLRRETRIIGRRAPRFGKVETGGGQGILHALPDLGIDLDCIELSGHPLDRLLLTHLGRP
jgi:hypothetical protein